MEDQNNIKNRCENNGCNGGRAFRIRDAMFCSPKCENEHFNLSKDDEDYWSNEEDEEEDENWSDEEEDEEEEEENCSGDEFKKKLNWILDDHESTIMEDQNNVDIEKKNNSKDESEEKEKKWIEKLTNAVDNLRMKGNDHEIIFPINEIDEVKDLIVKVILNYGGKVWLLICHNRVRHHLYKHEYSIEKSCKEIAVEIVVDLKRMRFNKAEGKFETSKEDKDKLVCKDFAEMFKVHAEHIKLKYQKCPCCFELTKTQFRKCKHNICVPCASRVVEKCNCEDEDCIDCNTFECPNCRGNHYCDDAIII